MSKSKSKSKNKSGSEERKRKKELREFGLTVGIAFVALGGILFGLKKPAYPYLFGVGTALILFGFIAPGFLGPVRRAWMGFSAAIGWVMTNIILSAAFYLIITPIGIALRLSGKELLDLRIDKSARSYWRRREPGDFDARRCESQY
ncbi:MAG: SxtJ family membrane protein [Armatimonadetes bacterium]|nr:SxtJ family membrane protein [Armatimonadota bacterium]